MIVEALIKEAFSLEDNFQVLFNPPVGVLKLPVFDG